MVIWKYPLQIKKVQVLQMPEGSQILCVQVQNNTPTLWACVDDSAQIVDRSILMAGTGHEFHGFDASEYIGTVQTDGGSFVWHCFDGGC